MPLRYYTAGPSRCPGCAGPDFPNKHPSCSFITCCVKKRNLEVCGECPDFPCPKFKTEEEYPAGEGDPLHTRRIERSCRICNSIKEHGIERFVQQQRRRIRLLERMINDFDDGRSQELLLQGSGCARSGGSGKFLGGGRARENPDGPYPAERRQSQSQDSQRPPRRRSLPRRVSPLIRETGHPGFHHRVTEGGGFLTTKDTRTAKHEPTTGYCLPTTALAGSFGVGVEVDHPPVLHDPERRAGGLGHAHSPLGGPPQGA